MLYAIEITHLTYASASSPEEAEAQALANRDEWLDPVLTVHQIEELADVPEHHRGVRVVGGTVAGVLQLEREQ